MTTRPSCLGLRRTGSRRLGLFAVGVVAQLAGPLGCTPAPRPSPLWGGDPLIPPLSVYVEAPDLSERLRAIDVETADLGLTMTFEARGKLAGAGGVVVVRAYEGRDALGRVTHAARVATSRGVIMAAGPPAYPLNEAAATEATEIVPALVPDAPGSKTGAFQAATDINGDGDPDLVLRAPTGTIEVWRLAALGASRYAIRAEVPPTEARDIDGDGTIDLLGTIAVGPGDRLRPDLSDYAVWNGRQYTSAAPGAKAEHAKKAGGPADANDTKRDKGSKDAPNGEPTKGPQGRPTGAPEAPKPEAPKDDATRLTRALELAWHTILSGESREAALDRLDKEPVPAELRSEFAKYRAIVGRALSH